ncbi:hypothetical protein SPRG_02984 [Saprolegnia parasitica CBS 223.65]|uniref:Uncharacterized protein n=1 Tax=Saprolegnia parasitica (strain CBS 223.65) TaxID=695850 RepID=A0A067D0C1_SAPPC|nr:hypothetical protein SPRG_02984 [Saprolegnia parasitica CBS 223.65]KDO32507.1 hypothetical protein SPRG_02984 [Saprolegnia parasitica CBS 223.65]|eukprot:XP_012196956.1 hypothetical protein SPRG_02984 [Saprolegnia parasitica CBS 223.65]
MKALSKSLPQRSAMNVRKSDLDLDLLRALATQDMHFSDDESDGVDSDEDLETILVPRLVWREPTKRVSPAKKRAPHSFAASPNKKPATDDDLGWTFIDKSPTGDRSRTGAMATLSQSWSLAS